MGKITAFNFADPGCHSGCCATLVAGIAAGPPPPQSTFSDVTLRIQNPG
jgi:hypothetical protein